MLVYQRVTVFFPSFQYPLDIYGDILRLSSAEQLINITQPLTEVILRGKILPHSAVLDPEKKRFKRLIFPTKYVIPKSIHWTYMIYMVISSDFHPLKWTVINITSFNQWFLGKDFTYNTHPPVGPFSNRTSVTVHHVKFLSNNVRTSNRFQQRSI